MERCNTWLESQKDVLGTAGSPKVKPDTPPAAHAAAAKATKKKKKKKGSGAGPAVNAASAQGSEELAPKLTGKSGSLSVTAPEAHVAQSFEFHPPMMRVAEVLPEEPEHESAQCFEEMVSSYQIVPIVDGDSRQGGLQ